jgi:hypothetical protein
MKTIISTAAVVLFAAGILTAGGSTEVRGRLVDAQGEPVANVDVSYYWHADGPLNGAGGSEARRQSLIANYGHMFPLGDLKRPARSGADGRFSIGVPTDRHHLLAIDQKRERGALILLPPRRPAAEIEMRLLPLVRVKGRMEGPPPGQRVEWPVAIANIADDPERPFDMTRLAIGGSFDGRFQFSLPPGQYQFELYEMTDDGDAIAEILPYQQLVVTGKAAEVDLGVLRLAPYKLRIKGHKQRSQASGRWHDYTKHYGEPAPPWHVVDARGADKHAQPVDFKGKWVLAYFWGMGCAHCLSDEMPKLMRFYADHAADRDRFEILALCMDPDGEMHSIADVDKQLQPIVDHIWHKPLPFPVLLDPSFTTWERYGLQAWGILILIDPAGNIVKGDETTLAAELRRSAKAATR